jgi:hypothetical protein
VLTKIEWLLLKGKNCYRRRGERGGERDLDLEEEEAERPLPPEPRRDERSDFSSRRFPLLLLPRWSSLLSSESESK